MRPEPMRPGGSSEGGIEAEDDGDGAVEDIDVEVSG